MDCGVSNEAEKEIKNGPPPGLSLGGDDRKLGGGCGWAHRLVAKKTKEWQKDTDPHMAEKISPGGVAKPYFEKHGDSDTTHI